MQIKYPVVALIMLLFMSCKNDPPKADVDTTLDISIRTDPQMLNPYVNPVALSREIYQYIMTPMADFHPETFKLTPILIKDIPVAENIEEGLYAGGTKYTIEFKEEAKWDDGSPITAKDLLFSVKAIKHPGVNAPLYRNYLKWISDIEIDPDNEKKATIYFKDYYILAKELVVTLQVYPQYVYDSIKALDAISLVDIGGADAEKIVEGDSSLVSFAEDFNSVKFGRDIVVNAGPYRLKEWISNQLIVLEKKENYWAEGSDSPFLQAHPEKIVFHINSDQTSSLNQVKDGSIDFMMGIPAKSYLDLKDNEAFSDELQFITQDLMRTYYIAINNSKPELADPAIRRALAKLNDVPKLIELLEGGMGKQTAGIIDTKKAYYNNTLKPIELDIEGAKKIFDEQGWSDTNNDGTIDKLINGSRIEMDLDFHITGSDLSKNISLLLKENAKKVGVNINIITKKYSLTRQENIRTRDYDLIPLALSQTLILDDPYGKWHSDNDDPSKANLVSYNSEEADALIEKILSTRDEEDREEYYKQLQEVMYNDQPVVFLYNPVERMILSNKWEGVSTLKRPGYMGNTFKPKS